MTMFKPSEYTARRQRVRDELKAAAGPVVTFARQVIRDEDGDLTSALLLVATGYDELVCDLLALKARVSTLEARLADQPYIAPPIARSTVLQMGDRLERARLHMEPLSSDAQADLDALDAAMDRAHIPATWERSGGKQS